MPSPFPGMDPFLDDPGLWPDFHASLISEARALLGKQLRPKYAVRIAERVYYAPEFDPGRSVSIPDIRIKARPERKGQQFVPESRGLSVDVAEPVVATILLGDEIHEARLEIIDLESELVVTVIELLSPANKVRGAVGRASFVRKRLEVMESPSHWVEIDLVRAGIRLATVQRLPAHEFLAYVSRVGERSNGLF